MTKQEQRIINKLRHALAMRLMADDKAAGAMDTSTDCLEMASEYAPKLWAWAVAKYEDRITAAGQAHRIANHQDIDRLFDIVESLM